jgi:hypothetical protein
MAMSNLKTLDDELNNLILTGRALEAMERFYAHDCAMQENLDAPMVGLQANLQREKEFFGMVEKYDGKLVSQAVGDDVTTTEWLSDVTLKNGFHYVAAQVAVRKWKDGKIVSERFYYKPPAA